MTKKALRPILELEPSTSEIEKFQNESLRPILKLQHELLVGTFEFFLKKRKQTIANRSIPERKSFIQTSLQKDQQLKFQLLGMIIGLLEVSELEVYHTFSTESNKRIISMLIKRLESVYCQYY